MNNRDYRNSITQSLVDELLVYLAPRLLGTGLGIANFGPLSALSDGMPLEFTSAVMVGPDLRVTAKVKGRDKF
jgi:diaminohydroxyphosphoribosylaminopyrimidine deaminase/5-amino-6-(5-phosphoribosylamino)uracil reductase